MTQRLEINKPSFFDFLYRLHAAPRRWTYPRHLRICFSQLHHFDPFCITSGFQLNGTSLHSFHVLLQHQQYEVVVAEGQHGKCSIAPVTTEVSNPCTWDHIGARLGFHSGNFSDITLAVIYSDDVQGSLFESLAPPFRPFAASSPCCWSAGVGFEPVL